MSNLTLDQRVLKVVERGLGLRVPTHIRHRRFLTGVNPIEQSLAEMVGGMTAGAQYMRIMGGRHQIEVRSDLRRYDADVALNHELRHAHQLERLGHPKVFRDRYSQSTRLGCHYGGCGCLSENCQVGYFRNHYEIEARHYEAYLRWSNGIPMLHQRPSRGTILRGQYHA